MTSIKLGLTDIKRHVKRVIHVVTKLLLQLVLYNLVIVTHIETDDQHLFRYFFIAMSCSILVLQSHICLVIFIDRLLK